MDDENKTTKKKDYDPQKDFIVETPQIVEEIIHIKSASSYTLLSNHNMNMNNSNNANDNFINNLNNSSNTNFNNINNNNTNKDQNFIVRKYQKGKFLGKGGFAKCFEMKCCQTNRFFAAKVFEKKALLNARSRKKLINEIKLHKKLQHENIVNFEHFFEDKENVYILLELCTNQTLNELLKRRKRLSDLETQYYCRQIIEALQYIHALNIIHRDLKLGNLFMNSGLNLKLGDFGLAAKLKFPGQKRKTICGTPNYIAPEILEKKNGHSFEVDIWSLGVIMYTLLVGKPPFETPEVKTTYKRIRLNNYSFPENLKIESKAKQLINSILVLDPIKRPTLQEILSSEYFCLFESLPERMPISALALPPTKSFVEQFLKKEKPKNEEGPNSCKDKDSFCGLKGKKVYDKHESGTDCEVKNEVICDLKSDKTIDKKNFRVEEKGKEKDNIILIGENNGEGLKSVGNNNGFTANLLLDNSDNKNGNSNSGNNEILNGNTKSNNINNNHNNQNVFLRNSINRFNTLSKQGNPNNNHQKNCNTEGSSHNNLNNKNLNIYENNNNINNNINEFNSNRENLNEYYTTENKEEIVNNNMNHNAIMSRFHFNQSEKLSLNANALLDLKTLEDDKTNSHDKDKNKISNNPTKNIINNNFFINVGNVNNMELKIDENFVKKIGNNCKIIIKEGQEGYTNRNNLMSNEKNLKNERRILKRNKIKKILEYGNFSFSNTKISFYVFNIANTYLGIYFSDCSNLIKNFNKRESAKSLFYYVDNKTRDSIKFDNVLMDSYLSKKTGISEDLYMKFEVIRQFNKKFENNFFEKISQNKDYKQSDSDNDIENLFIRKIIKNENAILLKLSNKIVQIFFMDNSKLAMTTDGEEVLYKNKKGNEFMQDSLENILSSDNNDLINKIKYAKNLLIGLVRNEKESNMKNNFNNNLINSANLKIKK